MGTLPCLICHKMKKKSPAVLVMAPTRELALQTFEVMKKVAVTWKIVCVYGGEPKKEQVKQLSGQPADAIVATPGRLLDLMQDGHIDLAHSGCAVLDEADRMLDMGFEPSIRKILETTPAKRQTLMFSATWPHDVQKLSKDFLKNPVHVTLGSKKLASNESVTQEVLVVEEWDKQKLLKKYLESWVGKGGKQNDVRVLIFGLYKKSVQRLADQLWYDNYNVESIHGDKSQADRNRAVEQFKSGQVTILVATDVAARGLDIKGVNYVLNFEFPLVCEDYVHRVGRTGRAGAKGTAVTFFTPQNKEFARELRGILQNANQAINKDFDALCEKAPPTIKRKTAADKMYGRGQAGGDMPMKAAEKVKFDDDSD